MAPNRCPREDPLEKVGASKVFEVQCPKCDKPVEFFGDEGRRTCSNCGEKVPNPNKAQQD